MKIIGIILIALGVIGLLYRGFTVWTSKKVIDAGPISIDANTPTTIWIPPTIASIMLGLGIAAVILG